MYDEFSNIDTAEDDAAKAAADGLPFEDTPPISEPPMTGEPDHDEAEDDTEDEDDRVLNGQEEPHPANPGGLYPISPKPALTAWINLSAEECAEKGKLLAKKLLDIEELKAERHELSAEISKAEKFVVVLRTAVLTGKIEVPAEQQDLLRQPVGGQAAAAAFDDMARDAAAANAPDLVQAAQDAAEAQVGLNAMAEGIQAANGIEAPGPGFLNHIENHKAKSAAKRKGAKVAG